MLFLTNFEREIELVSKNLTSSSFIDTIFLIVLIQNIQAITFYINS